LTHNNLKVSLVVLGITALEVLLFVQPYGAVEAVIEGDGLLRQSASIVYDLVGIVAFLNCKPAYLILDKDHFERVLAFCVNWDGVWVLAEFREDLVKMIVEHNRWELGGIIEEAKVSVIAS